MKYWELVGGDRKQTKRFFFFLLIFKTFYFVLAYSWLTMLWVSGGQLRDSVVHIIYPLFPNSPPHPGCHVAVSSVFGLSNRSWLDIHLIRQCVHVNSKLYNGSGKNVSYVTLGQRAEGGEGTRQMDIWKKREKGFQSHRGGGRAGVFRKQ